MPIIDITNLPAAPSRQQAPDAFVAAADKHVAALSVMVGQLNQAFDQIEAAETSAGNSAAAASADKTAAQAARTAAQASAELAAGYAGAAVWSAATVYAADAVVFSPSNRALFRRKAAGSSATDPANDAGNWSPVTLSVGGNAVWHAGNFNPSLKADLAGADFGALSVAGSSVWHAGNFNPQAYLPLAGGALTGSLALAGALSLSRATAGAVNARLTRGADPNFQLQAINGGTANSAGSLMAEFGLAYDGQVSNAAGLRFYRGGGVSESILGLVAGGAERVRINSNGAVNAYGSVSAPEYYSSGWFRNTATRTGIYNEANTNHIYSRNSQQWGITAGGSAAGGLVFFQAHETGNKGTVYWDGGGFGLLNDQGGWSVRANFGSSYGGKLYGFWNADALSSASSIEAYGEHYMRADVWMLNGPGNGWYRVIDRNGGSPIVNATVGNFGNATVTDGLTLNRIALGNTNVNDMINGSPWYGVGRLNADVWGSGGAPVQLAGYYGARIRTQGAILDIYMGSIATNCLLTVPRLAAGYDSGADGAVSASNWFRSAGNTGWYNQTYGGGIWMTDDQFVRTYAAKGFVVDSGISSYGMLRLSGGGDTEVSINYKFGSQTVAQGWTVGMYADRFFWFRDSVQRMAIHNGGDVAAAGRLFGNDVNRSGNGLGRITVSTGTPSGGAQGDVWVMY